MTADHAAALRPLLGRIASNSALPPAARASAGDAELAVDIEAVLARAGSTIVALESAATTAEAAAKELRAALLEVMIETGAPPFHIATHTIGYSQTPRVRITDEALIPPSFMTQPAPKPDTQAIRNALARGGTCPGAVLTNGEPTLFIRARRT
jgi:hypothetical protein